MSALQRFLKVEVFVKVLYFQLDSLHKQKNINVKDAR